MLFELSKVPRIEIASTLFVLPLVIWLTLYSAERWCSFNSGRALPWLKMLRWIGWAVGATLFVLSITAGRLRLVYSLAFTSFSAGLSMPESWIKRRLLR